MKAIETSYKGYRFRSRLEARWAIFLDELGIKWEYELEGYKLSTGEWYLPDFWLPDFNRGMHVEVKSVFTIAEAEKCRQLCEDSGKRVWLAEGTPGIRAWRYFEKDEKTNEIWDLVGIPNADSAYDCNRMFVAPGYENTDLTIPECYHSLLGIIFHNAVIESRSARFEFNERKI